MDAAAVDAAELLRMLPRMLTNDLFCHNSMHNLLTISASNMLRLALVVSFLPSVYTTPTPTADPRLGCPESFPGSARPLCSRGRPLAEFLLQRADFSCCQRQRMAQRRMTNSSEIRSCSWTASSR